METQIFWDIYNTREWRNSENWMIIHRHKKALEMRKRIWSTPKAWIGSTGEETTTKDDELKTVEHLHGKSPDKNIERKEWREFTWINGYLIKINESLKKRVGGQENKGNLGWTKQTPLRKLRIDLVDVENDRIHLKRSTPVGKELTWRPRWSRRISICIAIWEHHLGWGMESTLDLKATRIPQT